MAYETSAFGSADGSNVEQTVSNHYGPRTVGNQDGVYKTEGHYNEAAINFDGDSLDLPVYIPAGAYVIEVDETFSTGSVTTAEVGGTDVSLAEPSSPVEASGEVVIEGPTAGTVIVRYRHIA
jgi:hypothetical protein